MIITRRPRSVSAIFACALLASAVLLAAPRGPRPAADGLPERLTDQEFWTLSATFSEPDGTFHSENLVSNEARFQEVLPGLVAAAKPGGTYLGVGSEQNFTYMAALRPRMAFIVDIRRGNLDLHLLYKALFELSTDRADFIARLFSRPRPARLTAASTAPELFSAFGAAPASEAAYTKNLAAIRTHLVRTHGFGLSKGDEEGLEFVYHAMFVSGPAIHYQLTNSRGFGGNFPTYAELMTATDGHDRVRSYLASEDAFAYLKDLEARNLVVPVVGNFGGKGALRAVGAYLKQRKAVVSAFYVSNVEQYLRQDNLWDAFCGNVASLPLDGTSTFIRSARGGFAGQGRAFAPGFSLELRPIEGEIAACRVPGR